MGFVDFSGINRESGGPTNRSSNLLTSSSTGISQSGDTNAGRVSLSVSDLPGSALKSVGNVQAGFVGVTKGVVSLAENMPIIGGIVKPLTRFVGGIVDGTIGQVVRGAENLRFGETSLAQATANAIETIGTPLKWGMDALVAPGQWVQSEVAKSRINSTLNGQQDFIRTVFGDAPAAAVESVRNGSSIEEAASKLAESNSGFSADSAQNLIWSLVLDPMNLVTFGAGKALSVAAKASEAAKFIRGGIEVADFGKSITAAERALKITEAQQFVDKWDWAGKIYDATIGAAKGKFALFAPKLGKEITKVVAREMGFQNADRLLSSVERVSGAGGRAIAEQGLRNFAITASGAVRSGVVRMVSSIRRMGSDNFARGVVTLAEREIRNGSDIASILATQMNDGLTLGAIMEKSGIKVEEQIKFLEGVAQKTKGGIRADEMLRTEEVQSFVNRFSKGHGEWTVKNKAESIRSQAKLIETTDARIASEQATRIFSDAKIEQFAIVQNALNKVKSGSSIADAASGFIDDLVNGFGMTKPNATKVAEDMFSQYGNDVRGLSSVFTIARSANYGRKVEGLALLRGKLRMAIETKALNLLKYTNEDVQKLARVTLISMRTLTEGDVKEYTGKVSVLKAEEKAAVAAGDEIAAKAARTKMADLADEIVYRFDDAAAAFDPQAIVEGMDPAVAKAANKYGYDDVFSWVEKSKGMAAEAINSKELTMIQALAEANPILKDLLRFSELDLIPAGYRLGFAPESGVVEKMTLRHLDNGGEMWQSVTHPFTDTLDMVDIQKLDSSMQGMKLRPTKVDQVLDLFTRKYGPEVMRSASTERFISSMVKNSGVSVRKARSLLSAVNNLAAELNLRPQALFLERNLVNDIFVKGMSELEYRTLIKSGSDPMTEIIRASAGDFRSAGLTSGFTGRVKSIAPAITIVTDRLWGEVKFGRANPYFQLVLERVETEFQLIANGIYRKVSDQFGEDFKGTILLRNLRDRAGVSKEFADGMVNHTRRRTEATVAMVEQAPGFRGVAGRVLAKLRVDLKSATSIDQVMLVKQAAADITANRFATGQIVDIINRVRPDIFPLLGKHYGVTGATDVMELVLGEIIMMSEPALRAELIAKGGGVARSLTSEAIVSDIARSLQKELGLEAGDAAAKAAKLSQEISDVVVGAFEVAIERGGRAADQAQFFSSYRTWFERSINHPLLALYPYSYMTQKAIPSMMKLMFATRTPSGLLLPGLGYIKYQQVAEYLADEMNSNSGFVGQILNSEPLMLLMMSLLPTSPEDMGFSVSSAFRGNFIAPALQDKAINMKSLENVASGVKDSVWAGTFPGQLERLSRVGRQTFAQPGNELNLNQGITNQIEGAFSGAADLLKGNAQGIQQQVQSNLDTLRNP